MQALWNPQIETDHVLVIVQLNGGNDGLNIVIPISDYSAYYNSRTNIAIPEYPVVIIVSVKRLRFGSVSELIHIS